MEYTLNLTDDWLQQKERTYPTYQRSDPWGFLWVKPAGSGRGGTLKQHAESVRDGLEQEVRERWPSYSLFELTSFAEIQAGGQDFYEITYRMQESPEYCVVAVAERIASSETWYGVLRSVRAISWMCEGDVYRHGKARAAMLDTFRVTAKPSDYYTQAVMADGVLVKATGKVDPVALSVAADVVSWMLDGRQDIAECMPAVGAAIAIIPKDEFITTLPEFARLKGRTDFTGRTYESFQLRGTGAAKGQPVTATGEEDFLGRRKNINRTIHEFAHAIHNLCFTPADHQKWNDFYTEALESNLYPSQHAMHDVYEFFAVLSNVYFGITAAEFSWFGFKDESGSWITSKETIKTKFPEVFEALKEFYGEPRPFTPSDGGK